MSVKNAALEQETNEMLTIVSNSPPPSEDSDELLRPNDIGAAIQCKNRAAGQICICDTCEAARTRLLHRANKNDGSSSSSSSSKKRARPDEAEEKEEDVPEKQQARSSASELQTKKPSSFTTFSVAAAATTTTTEEDVKLAKMSAACKTILECIGEDPDREGLVKTPERWAKALSYMCHGYQLTPESVTNGAVFSENHDEMVVVRNISIHSLCEHHMVPFTGVVHIGYIPNGKVIGLSKLARIAELYARRLQVQERLTRQIADAVLETVTPLGVAVVVECTHMCMVMRGVQKTGAVTTTSSVRGCFETNPKTRAEFFSILHGGVKNC